MTIIRLWTHGETTHINQVEDAGYDERLYAHCDSIPLEQDRCDDLYHQWAASDFMGSFYNYVKMVDDPNGHLTDQERLSRIQIALRSRILTEEILEVHGGPITADDLNHIDEQVNLS